MPPVLVNDVRSWVYADRMGQSFGVGEVIRFDETTIPPVRVSRRTLLENDLKQEVVINEQGKQWETHLSRGTLPENDSKHELVINSIWEIMGNAF